MYFFGCVCMLFFIGWPITEYNLSYTPWPIRGFRLNTIIFISIDKSENILYHVLFEMMFYF